jgi:hypothetical protein
MPNVFFILDLSITEKAGLAALVGYSLVRIG